MPQNPPVIGHYEILEPLGEGGMGTVFRARHRMLGREVALKLLKNPNQDPRLEQRFLREMRLMVELEHPALVRVLDGGVDALGPYLAMELVPGSSLRQVVADQGRLSSTELLAVAGKLADGLAHLHERDILHRDLSPGNVILTPDGAVKILDFGLARPMDATMLTVAGDVIGTPSVLAPEAVLKGEHTQATDLWAMGCLMYLLATGRSPFPAKTVADLFAQVATHPIQPPAAVVEEVPEAVSQLVMGLLERDPARRGPPAKELAVQCRRLAGLRVASHAIRRGIAVKKDPATRDTSRQAALREVPPRESGSSRDRRRRSWLFLGVGAGLAGLLAVVLVIGLRPPRAPALVPPSASVAATPEPPAAPKVLDWAAQRDAIPELRAGGPRAKAAMRRLSTTFGLALPETPALWLFAFDLSAWLSSPSRGSSPPGSAGRLEPETVDEMGQLLLHEGWRYVLDAKPDPRTMLAAGLRHLFERPHDGRNWMMLGMVVERQGRPEAARVLYRVGLSRMRHRSLLGASFYGEAAAWMVRNLGLGEAGPQLDKLFPPGESESSPWPQFVAALERADPPFLRTLLEGATSSEARAPAAAPALARLYESLGDRKRQLEALERGLGLAPASDALRQALAEYHLGSGNTERAVSFAIGLEDYPLGTLLPNAPRPPAGAAPLDAPAVVVQAWVHRALLDEGPAAALAIWSRWKPGEKDAETWGETTVGLYGGGAESPELLRSVRLSLSDANATFADPAFDLAAGSLHLGARARTMEAELDRIAARPGMQPLAAVCRALWLSRRGLHDAALEQLREADRESYGKLVDVCLQGKQERAPLWIAEVFLRAAVDPERARRVAGRFDGFRRQGLAGRAAIVGDALGQDWTWAVRRAREVRHEQPATLAYLAELLARQRDKDRAGLERIVRIIQGHVRLRRTPLWLYREAQAALKAGSQGP